MLVLVCAIMAQGQQGQTGIVEPVPSHERRVGIAYTLWMDYEMWQDTWGTALLGRYDSRDRRIIRQHAAWFVDAGVDFIWIDWSNQINYDPGKVWTGGRQDLIEDGTAILFDEYSRLVKHPKISIFLGVTGAPEALFDGRLQKKADQVYDMYAAHPEYGPMMEMYLGKPLLVIYVDTPSPWQEGLPLWDDERFTVRWMTGYVSEQTPLVTNDRVSRFGYWSWEDRGLQTFPIHNQSPEAMVVTAATREQLASGPYLFIPAKGRRDGQTFLEAWARVHETGPKYAMVVSWNEWVRGEQPSVEVSKDIEPSEEFGTFYLDILREEIQKFKNGGGKTMLFTDPRDGKTYSAVRINNQVWLASNLSYKPPTGQFWSYGDDEHLVSRYGYLYDWETAQTVCPPGWRLPNYDDWYALLGQSEEAKAYQSTSGWGSEAGMDTYGFRALPGGLRRINSDYINEGVAGFWWSANAYSGNTAYFYAIRNNSNQVLNNYTYRDSGLSVRCIRAENNQ